MAVKGCPACMKYTLVSLNVLVMLAGIAAIAVGAWALAAKDGSISADQHVTGSTYRSSSIAVIVFGSFTFLLAFLGCCGAVTENRAALSVYFTFVLLLVIAFVVLCVFLFVNRNKVKEITENHIQKNAPTICGGNGTSSVKDCEAKQKEILKRNFVIVGGVVIGVFVMMLISAIFAIVVCASIDEN